MIPALLVSVLVAWLARTALGNQIVQVGVILPTDRDYPWAISETGPGIEYAVESIHNRSDLLENYTLSLHYGDSQCSNKWGPLECINMIWRGEAHVFLGPACDYAVAPIARFSPEWDIPIITGGAMVKAFSNKEEYKLLTRISGSYIKLGLFFLDVFTHYNWTRPGYLYQDNSGANKKHGKSNCFFKLEAIFETLMPRHRQFHPNEPIWQKNFDENGQFKPNFTEILNVGKDSLHLNTRGKD